MRTKFWSGNLKGRDRSEDLEVDGKIILQREGVEWIHLAQDRDQLRHLVTMIMNLRVP
jgi:hypothetical protein